MGIYDGIGSAQGSRGGKYFTPGHYRVRIDRCKASKDRFLVDMFVAEFTVLESDNDVTAVGDEVGYVIKLDGEMKMKLGNIADLIRPALVSQMLKEDGLLLDENDKGLIGTSPAEEAQTMYEITGPDNILAGAELKLYAFNKKTREGNDFTALRWSVPEDVKARAVASAQGSAGQSQMAAPHTMS